MENKNWSVAIRLQHWLTVLVMVCCIGAVWSHEAFEKTDPVRAQLMQLHFLLGAGIGVLTLLRLATRAVTKRPDHQMSTRVNLMSKLGHGALYLLMVLLPMTGYLAVSGKGVPIDILGLFSVPPWPVNAMGDHAAGIFKEIHEGMGNALIALIAVHIAAVVYHVVVVKDNVLKSMLGKF